MFRHNLPIIETNDRNVIRNRNAPVAQRIDNTTGDLIAAAENRIRFCPGSREDGLDGGMPPFFRPVTEHDLGRRPDEFAVGLGANAGCAIVLLAGDVQDM